GPGLTTDGPGLPTPRSAAGGVIDVSADEHFCVSKGGCSEMQAVLCLTVLPWSPPTSTTIVTVTVRFGPISEPEQSTLWPLGVQVSPGDALARANVVPLGMLSVMWSVPAALGPVTLPVVVYVSSEPAAALDGAVLVIASVFAPGVTVLVIVRELLA